MSGLTGPVNVQAAPMYQRQIVQGGGQPPPPPYVAPLPMDQGASAASAQSGFSDGGWSYISTDSAHSEAGVGYGVWPPVPPPLPAAFPGPSQQLQHPSYMQVQQQQVPQMSQKRLIQHQDPTPTNGYSQQPGGGYQINTNNGMYYQQQPQLPQVSQQLTPPTHVINSSNVSQANPSFSSQGSGTPTANYAGAQPAPATPQEGQMDVKYICRHFVKGRCTWGAECRFYHPSTAADRDRNERPGIKKSPPQQTLAVPIGMRPTSQQMSGQPFVDQFSQLQINESNSQAMPPQQQVVMVQPGFQGRGFSGNVNQEEFPMMRSIQPANQSVGVVEIQSGSLSKYSPAPKGMSSDEHVAIKQRQIIAERQPTISDAINNKYTMTLTEDGYVFELKQGAQSGSTYILDKLVESHKLSQELAYADSISQDIQQGGLFGLLSEETLFWSAVQSWHVHHTTHNQRWDEIFKRAAAGDFDCPFQTCGVTSCTFRHPTGQPSSPAADSSR